MAQTGKNSLKTKKSLSVDGEKYYYYSLDAAQKEIGDISRLPHTLKILMENLLRHEDGKVIHKSDIKALADWQKEKTSTHEIAFKPARVLMQDFTGVPAIVDLAAMREAVKELGGNPAKINPLIPVDLVIDHSVIADEYGNSKALQANIAREFERNTERYTFLKWAQSAFDNFRVVPPDTGICHQINLEYLAKSVWLDDSNKKRLIYPDTLVGTDLHTTMVNALGVLGWGVGGIEAEAAMLGQAVSMLVPDVIGFKLTGKMQEGVTAMDLALYITRMLKDADVTGKFVEFYGNGLDNLSLTDRATISNMAPEYGAVCSYFPIDKEVINYLRLTGRDEHHVNIVEAYANEQGLWRTTNTSPSTSTDTAITTNTSTDTNTSAAIGNSSTGTPTTEEPLYTSTMHLDLSAVNPSIAGPNRPQDRIELQTAAATFKKLEPKKAGVKVKGEKYKLGNGDIVIAAITSCTNTSNPSVMIAAGLLARKARVLGLNVKPWVKTSLAAGSRSVTGYLAEAGLQDDLDALGFNIVGYGCTTCVGNSGALPSHIVTAIEQGNLNVASVLSGNRNFERSISPYVKSNYLAGPPLVIAYAIAGSMRVDITREPLGKDKKGREIFLKDIWPSTAEIAGITSQYLTSDIFTKNYADIFEGSSAWRAIGTNAVAVIDEAIVKAADTDNAETLASNAIYSWRDGSTYVRKPPFFKGIGKDTGIMQDIQGAYALVVLGDNITTDHISPAGAIIQDSPSGEYLTARQIEPLYFNSYGARRGNDQVMIRGIFANIDVQNEMLPETQGGYTKHIPSGEEMSIYDAAMRYQADEQSMVVIAGKNYGIGSSRDWAAKGTRLLGIKAIIAESFGSVHRANLIRMGVLPLQFKNNMNRKNLNICGDERYNIFGIAEGLEPRTDVMMTIDFADGTERVIALTCRIDTKEELEYYRHGGILNYVLRQAL